MPAQIVSPTPASIYQAGEILRRGALVAFPTETVYGLGGDATSGEAVARIFAAKGRPSFNPLIVHMLDVDSTADVAEMPPVAAALARTFWPGPLTLVLPRRDDSPVHELVSAGLPTIALRVPDHPVARAVLAAAGRPIAAPSANTSGRVSATQAAHVAADLGTSVELILDGGPTFFGIESTIVRVDGDDVSLLRPGAITIDAIARAIDRRVTPAVEPKAVPVSPGQLASHYAPRAKVRLDTQTWTADEAVLAFGMTPPIPARVLINLSEAGDLIEAAANLFAALRKLDASGADTIAVMPVPDEGLGEAINDRLRRAAARRQNS